MLLLGCCLEFILPSLYLSVASFCIRVYEMLQISFFLFRFNSKLFGRIAWKFVGGWFMGWGTYLSEAVLGTGSASASTVDASPSFVVPSISKPCVTTVPPPVVLKSDSTSAGQGSENSCNALKRQDVMATAT
jgi:hypothetical protein